MGEVLLGRQRSQEGLNHLELLPDLTKGTLQELGIDILGNCLAILRHARSLTVTPSVVTQPTPIKAPAAKLPQINTDMTLQQFRKFLIDWNVFKQIPVSLEHRSQLNCTAVVMTLFKQPRQHYIRHIFR